MNFTIYELFKGVYYMFLIFTPLNISNGTPSGRHSRDLRATLPINELKGNPLAEDCPISNLHRCISFYELVANKKI